MSEPQMQKIYQKDPNIVSRVVAGEVILVPIRNNVTDMDYIYTLNETAARVWALTDGQHSLADIHQSLILEFDADADEIAQDLAELTHNLVDIGAIIEVTALTKIIPA